MHIFEALLFQAPPLVFQHVCGRNFPGEVTPYSVWESFRRMSGLTNIVGLTYVSFRFDGTPSLGLHSKFQGSQAQRRVDPTFTSLCGKTTYV